MIRLVGYVNGVEVTFTFTPPKLFRGVVPASLNGQYYIDLRAVDEAGNQTNYMELHVLIDFDALSFKILDERYNFNVEDKEDISSEIFDNYLINELNSSFSYSPCTLYNFKELMLDANI
jgi:hypothetical protein